MQYAKRTRQRAGQIADGHADAFFTDVEPHDAHA